MLKEGFVTLVISGLVVFSGLGAEGPAIIQVIYRPTAYTLPAGSWEITASFVFPYMSLPSLGASYGLSKDIQVGTDVTSDLFGIPNLSVKLALEMAEPLSLAIPAGFTFFAAQGSLYAASGLAISWKGPGPLRAHTGSIVVVLPSFSLSPYLALDYELVAGTELLAELDILPFQARVGALLAPFESFALRLWTAFPELLLGATGTLRF